MAIVYGTGWGRTRHILVGTEGAHKRSVCGAAINENATTAAIAAKPICGSCARARRITPCSRCGGTGQEPAKAAT